MPTRAHEAGCFVVSWSQTDVDGLSGAPVDAVRRGAEWRWRGDAIRLDAATGLSGLLDEKATRIVRRHAESRVRELVGRALFAEGHQRPELSQARTSQCMTLTDGPRRWVASLIDVPEFSRPLILFIGDLPPQGINLRVAHGPDRPSVLRRSDVAGEGVVCFVSGTKLETTSGRVPIDEIVAGDRVITKDGGPREVLWVGARRVSMARLLVSPDLCPVMIRAGALGDNLACDDLFVSPDHRMLVHDDDANTEVLVAARDLIGRPGIIRASISGALTYFHVMLADHAILVANGVESESFHPAASRLSAIAEEQRARLFDLMPDLRTDAANYGPPARRVVARANGR